MHRNNTQSYSAICILADQSLPAHCKHPKLWTKLTNKQPNIISSRNSICSQALHTRLVYFSKADFIFNTRLCLHYTECV